MDKSAILGLSVLSVIMSVISIVLGDVNFDDSSGAVQHHAGGRCSDQRLPCAHGTGCGAGVQRQSRGLHRARQDHHAAEGPHRLGDSHALSGDAGRGHGHHRAGGLGLRAERRPSRYRCTCAQWWSRWRSQRARTKRWTSAAV